MYQRLKNALLILVALTSVSGAVSAATLDIRLSLGDDGFTKMEFLATGAGSSLGAGNEIFWANLVGGDPFDNSLDGTVVFFDPIDVQNGISLVALRFGTNFSGPDQDDITLIFDDLLDLDGTLLSPFATRLLEIDFDLFYPGEYTRTNSLGELTITTVGSPVPLPAALPLLLSAVGAVFAVGRRSAKRASR